MANRFFNPNEQFCDPTGLPYANGTLAFYASGTSTPLNTYSDSALATPNTNPVVLDSAGRSGNVFLQNLAYKVVLSDVNSNIIWTEDPVYASDYSTRAKLTSGAGSPNGAVAGTAGSTGIGADTYWDNVNNILYVCTSTGTTSTAVWTAINASTATPAISPPQGYLTPTSGTPIITSDVISATSLVYTPYVGNTVPIYNGTAFTPLVFSELTLTLSASHAIGTIYDVFIYNNTGVLTLVTGPAWASSAAGTSSRGAATALTRLNGLWVNNISMTGRNGASTPTIPANQGTYLGSIYIDSVAGQITFHRSYGQSRKWSAWNCYNRVPIELVCGDSSAAWSYSTNSWRLANGSSNNNITAFQGLAEEQYDFAYQCWINANAPNGFNSGGQIGVGFNSTSSPSGTTGYNFISAAGGATVTAAEATRAEYNNVFGIGVNTVNALENGLGSTNTATFGGSGRLLMQLSARWRG